MQSYDLVVIGSGPSGRRAAVQAAKLGRSVLVIEKGRRVGGVSVHTGTIPSKTLRETVLNLTGWRERGFYGLAYRVKQDIEAGDLTTRLHKTLEHEVETLEHQFARNRVHMLRGLASFVNPHRIEVQVEAGESRTVEAARVVIAVGTRPLRPPHIPFNRTTVIDSDELVDLTTLPRSITVVGAGVIGVEYATIFSALDVRVTLVEPRSSFLDFVDRELVDDFVHQLRDRGVGFRLGSKVQSIEFENSQPVAMLEGGRRVRSEMLLFTAGRVGATDTLNLSACGLASDDRGRLTVDPQTFQTTVPHIYATGDVIGFPSLASTSLEQGRIAACHACGEPLPSAPAFFPYGIYSVPEISTVGLSEEEVRRAGTPYECGIARLRETSRGHIMGLNGGLLKMIVSIETRRILGVHIVGEGATELVHIGQAVLNLGGTLDYFIDNTFNYPTLAEAYKIAALDAWNRLTPRKEAVAEVTAVSP
ncbi:Si-specific NAD(P)(+) transhydrogenase [Belnapia sp. T6]|uniref:Soluble pyridine nucleotide transhydrogenase n=1 Tax=Belnapia mucosa TaxID=2804532 RepID=A0ABS1VAR0_9PROT|nr:Si-specific NAD(P)(+) transhydrogenase [Belnapia mucosa]MBL6458771.1 Si-specific NAD(P)(+) transhydrogenase [Belnapia mucosa]